MSAPYPSLIVNADDLGIHPAINAGIFEAFERGVATSATLLMTTPFLEETVRTAQARQVPVGLHLSLTLGKAIAPPASIADLVDEAGYFKHSAPQFLFLRGLQAPRRTVLEQIRREFEAQLAAGRDLGIAFTHVDSHQHVHMNPHIFKLAEDTASRFGISRIRFSRESVTSFGIRDLLSTSCGRKNLPKLLAARFLASRISPRLRTSDWYFGLAHSGLLQRATFLRLIEWVKSHNAICEIGIHPGRCAPDGPNIYPQPGVDGFIRSAEREMELAVLTDPMIRREIERRDVCLNSFETL